jgi:hypothetical protein
MSVTKQAIVGPGRFQWNPGGWWGASLGATVWMLVTAGFLVVHDQAGLSLVPMACFLFTNLVAGLLWVRRDRLFPFRGLLILLSVLAIAVPLVWTAVGGWASSEVLQNMNWPSSVFAYGLVFLLVPAIMIWFSRLEYLATRSQEDASPDS